MLSPLLLSTLRDVFAVGMSLFYVTTLNVDHEISQVTSISDIREMIDRMEYPWEIYRYLLPLANQGDPRVDVVLVTMERYPYHYGRGNAFSLDEESYLKHTAIDPRLVDVIWCDRDWVWSKDWPATHDDVTAEDVQNGTFLTHLFARCAGEGWNTPRCLFILWYVALTEHYELLKGHETEVEIIQCFDENIESLRAELPYLRFDIETRKYVLDEEAEQSQTPVDPRYQEIVGRPTGPAEGWEGDVYVGDTSSN